MRKRFTNEQFIERANKVHNGKYSYEKVNYTGALDKVVIICPVHGEFRQFANIHMDGRGCLECARSISRSSKDEFIRKAQTVHGFCYAYDKVNYISDKIKVEINCSEHGSFFQSPNSHVNGAGCPDCGLRLRASSLDEFIKNATKIHGSRYDYSLVNYTMSRKKVRIICPEHGEFEQSPNSHLNKHGCPNCNESKGEAFVYKILNDSNIVVVREYKIPQIEEKFRYDFYLPEHNVLIEFHGKQHYEHIEYFHRTKELFISQLVRDVKKKECAKAWGYRLLVIHYKLFETLDPSEFEKRLLNFVQLHI